jgi:hypothetical protein
MPKLFSNAHLINACGPQGSPVWLTLGKQSHILGEAGECESTAWLLGLASDVSTCSWRPLVDSEKVVATWNFGVDVLAPD